MTAERKRDRYLSPRAVAEQLDVSVRTVRRWLSSGELRHYRLGGQIRIAQADLEAFLYRHRSG